MPDIIARNWKDYELIDCGDGKKLERFGDKILIRPEIAAKGNPILPNIEWKEMAHHRFEQKSKTSGVWTPSSNKEWQIGYDKLRLKFELKLTGFKHVGVFPEQSTNWTYINNQVHTHRKESKVLNLFAYTGGASLAAKAAGADVFHVDSLKQLVNWSSRNQELSKLNGIRWVVEDALKFASREAKRGNKYNGVIMDPPSWGRGPKGERWKLEDQLDDLIRSVQSILAPRGFLVINTYSGIPPETLRQIAHQYWNFHNKEHGHLCLKSTHGSILQTGSLVRGIIKH